MTTETALQANTIVSAGAPGDAAHSTDTDTALAPSAFSLPVMLRMVALREQSYVRLLFKTWTLIFIVGALLIASVVYNIIQAQRVGTVVLLDKTTGVAVSVNNRTFGNTPAGALVPDQPGEFEMKIAAKTFLESVYKIDPVAQVRLKEGAAGLRNMTPLSAAKYGGYIEEKGIWNIQIAQSQSASWTVKDENIKIESREPIIISVYGEQRLKKMEGGATKFEVKQIMVPVTLMPDPEGRTERNFLTGFNVDSFGPEKVLSSSTNNQDSFITTPQAPGR